MGIDVSLWSHIDDPTSKQLADIRARLTEIDDDPAIDDPIEVGPVPFILPGETDTWADMPNGVMWNTFYRLWSPGYEKGHWPTIKLAIEAFRAVFGHAYYHGDNAVYATLVDDDMMLMFDTAYTEPEED